MSEAIVMEGRQELFERLKAEPFPLPLGDGAASAEASSAGEDRAAEAAAPIYAERAPAKTVTLAYPFALDGQTVETVGLLPPPFTDVEAVSAGEMAELEMIGGMAGLPLAALKAMRWPDIEAVTKAAQRLAPKIERR